MAIDPTAFTRVGTPDATPRATLGALSAFGQGQQDRLREQQSAQNLRIGEVALQQKEATGERESVGRDLIQKAIQSYKTNDTRGFQQQMASAASYLPQETQTIMKLLQGVDKTNAVQGSHHLLAAGSFKNNDEEAINSEIRKGIDAVGANSELGMQMQRILTMQGVEKQEAITDGLEFAKMVGYLPGVAKQQEAERKERGLDIEQQKIEAGAEARKVQWEKISMDKDQFDRRMNELSAGDKKILEEGIQGENQAIADSEQMTGILAQIEKRPDLTGGGVFRQLGEYAKRSMGVGDDQTAFTQMLQRIRVDQGIKNLPPGVASDKDIELVMSGIPTAQMGKADIISWLKGRKKLAVLSRVYHESKNDWFDKNPNQRGFASQWRTSRKQKVSDALQDAGLALDMTEQGAKQFGSGVEEMAGAVGKLAGQVEEALPAITQAGEQVGQAAQQAGQRVRVKLDENFNPIR